MKRTRILARDNYSCTKCGTHEGENVALHVHHLHYIYGLDPWEYKDSELVTLCEQCHSDLHKKNKVPVCRLDGENLVEVQLTPCVRCGGAGWFSEYRHIQGGICFRCYGAKYDEIIHVVEKYAKEHDINLNDIDDGFQKFGPKIEKLGTIVQACVHQSQYKNLLYLQLMFDDGVSRICCLDFSVDAKPGDQLDTNKLRYRKAVKKNGEKYVIVKGERLIPSAELGSA